MEMKREATSMTAHLRDKMLGNKFLPTNILPVSTIAHEQQLSAEHNTWKEEHLFLFPKYMEVPWISTSPPQTLFQRGHHNSR